MAIHNRYPDSSRVNFHDLFDLETIQKIQDAFALATGVASIITDTKGVPITQPSNFCDLCQNVIRKTETGLANCFKSDAILGQINTGGPTVQPCLSGGLLDGGTSIMAGDQHVANWLIGQVLDESCDIEAMKAYAREIGADEELYCQALGKVTRMPREKFDHICQMLFLIASQLSEQAHLNVQLANNMTKRVRAEKALQDQNQEYEISQRALIESEARFKALHAASFGGIVIHDNGKILDCNQSLSGITGFTNEELIGMDGFKLIAPDSLNIVLQNVQSDYDQQYEVEGIRKDGSVYPLALRGKNIQYQGRAARVVEFRDISARRQAEDALREREERFRQVALASWVWETDLDGRYTYCSDNVIDVLGYSPEEMLGKTPFDFMPDQEAVRVKGLFTEIMSGKKRIIDLENWNITKDGSEACLLTNGGPFFDKAGNLIGYRGGDKDITDRIRAEAQIEKMNKDLQARTEELEQVNQDLETFSYSVSHDLCKPLTIINGYTQLIRDSCSTNMNVDCKSYIQVILDSVQRMDELIDTILKFSSSHSSELDRDMVNLSQIAHEVALELTLTEPSRQVSFRIDNEITINGDARLLRVVLENLIGNAWKYTKKKKNAVIEFGVADVDGKPVCFVRDNGAGFDMVHVENLFTPFKRLFSSEDFLGHGIGLSIVDRIISRHGGKIWAESKPGKGATFFFTL
jgi:PAS domain S-box-containing protein